jgi:hypothetical protein
MKRKQPTKPGKSSEPTRLRMLDGKCLIEVRGGCGITITMPGPSLSQMQHNEALIRLQTDSRRARDTHQARGNP